ncbi:RtcB family protein [Candidatus Dependentiae bacterium]|nr:RtcB family protein [Candidatus Dependentiae bacterium]
MAHSFTRAELLKIHNSLFEIPKTYRSDMRVPARLFVSDAMLNDILQDESLLQMVNVATLPGILEYALAMPDIHQGYGFPIGGVAALDINNGGVISPGGIGYDINCGVRLLSASLTAQEIKPYLEELATALFYAVPSGVGRGGKTKLSDKDLKRVLLGGAHTMVEAGHGNESDLEHCEENGRMTSADADCVSEKAKQRGIDQLGTLGSGNHFLEIQQVSDIYDPLTAAAFGLEVGMVTIMIHCGSRGLGHQTCTDYVRTMLPKLSHWGIELPDRELACAPFNSQEGKDYFGAMCASANFAWANRHLIGDTVRKTCKKIIGSSVDVKTIYDVSHNMGKREQHEVNGKLHDLIVHRKGATRAFAPGHPEVPLAYRAVGQPVLIPGTMGTSSYVLVGTQESMQASFGSCCHGAGRKMSRVKAKKTVRGATLREELEARGIIIRCDSDAGLAEEAPFAYKDVDDVIDVVQQAHLARKVAKLTPLAVIKGG